MSQRLRVLVVDDNLDLAEGLGSILETEGMVVETAHTAEKALARAAETDFDVVILDFKLPGLSGFDARRAIVERLPRARCLTMSGWRVDHLLEHILGADRVRVLRHPFSAASLRSTLVAVGAGGLVLVAGVGEASVDSLSAQLDELGIERALAADAAAARAALERPGSALLLDLGRPIVEMLDVYFRLLRSSVGKILESRRVLLHARPLPPDTPADDLIASQASTGIFVKPMFDFEEMVRVVRGPAAAAG